MAETRAELPFIGDQVGLFKAQPGRPSGHNKPLTGRDGIFKISDVIIDGLSMAANGRSQLEGVVERSGGRPRVILPVMRQQIASLYTR
jgi:hypothetical protein